jgi:hypothetical protein
MDTEHPTPAGRTDVLLFPSNDPLRILRDALDSREASQTPPKDILMGWLLSLPSRVDPADAAAAVLASQTLPTGVDASYRGRLLGLLIEVCRHPQLAGESERKRSRSKRGEPRKAAWARMLGGGTTLPPPRGRD